MGQTKPPATATAERSTLEEAAPADPSWQACGQHRFYLHEDVLFWEAHGPMTIPDLKVFFEERMVLQRQRGPSFLLFDAHAMSGTSAESRRYAAMFKPDPPIRGPVVLLGASLITRTAVSLIMAAARLLGRKDLKTVFFAAKEDAAWAIIDRERRALRTAEPPG